MASGPARFILSIPQEKEGWEELQLFFFLFHNIINFIGTDWFLIITITHNIYKTWAWVQMETQTWEKPYPLPPFTLFCITRDLPNICLAPISQCSPDPDRHTLVRTDPGKRPKVGLEVGFRSLDRDFLETSVPNHSPNCPDLDNGEIHNGLQKKLPGFLRMRGLCIFLSLF